MKFAKQCLAILLIYPLTLAMLACSTDEILSSIDVALQTAQGLEAAIGAVSPADAAALGLLTGLGIQGITAIKTAYDDYEKNKTASALQNVVAAAQAVQTNLPQELAALKIASTDAVQKATAWVNLMGDCAVGVITAVKGTSSLKKGTRTLTYSLTPESIQAQWASNVCKGDAACTALVKVHHKHAPVKL
jgi:hypothetical protein